MRLRSLLFVPGDRPDRMEKAHHTGADALILDLEDAVAASAKPAARLAVAAFLHRREDGPKLFVRVHPLDSGLILDDLAAAVFAKPDGLVLPKADGPRSVRALAAMSAELPILPIATETPAAILLGSHARAVVAAFEAEPDAGALQIKGRMIDAPHLKQARRLLELA